MTAEALQARLSKLRSASRQLRSAATADKNRALDAAARGLAARESELRQANAADVADARNAGSAVAFLDRLTLDSARIAHMAESLRQVAALADPVGEVVEQRTLVNGLSVSRVRSPLGVIFMIFESRPNVAVEAFSLAFKAGNAVILRGGKESMRTTAVLYAILGGALREAGLSEDLLWGIDDPDRALVEALLQEKRWIDVVVPRGGEGLIDFVSRASRIPVIKNDRGLCHVYLHDDANARMAEEIVFNAKTQRPGVCNAMETLLVHEKRAAELLPKIHARLATKSVEWFGCPHTVAVLSAGGAPLPGVSPATTESWNSEYLDFKLSCRVVQGLDEAIAHIEEHGSRHSEAIITASPEAARKFQGEVDAAAVYWNASTRFTDGFELGLGGELGISTQKLHVRGPVGLRELTSVRWVMEGQGQVRG